MESTTKIESCKIIRTISFAIFVLFFVSLFIWLFLSMFQGGIPPIPIYLFALLILLLLANTGIFYLALNKREQQRIVLDTWKNRKKAIFPLRINKAFERVRGEKIIFPITTCYLETRGLCSWKHLARDVIVTNKRILIGFITNLPPTQPTEIFGQMNLWHPNIKKIPKLSQQGVGMVLGGDSRIKNITMGSKDKIEYLKIETEYPVSHSITMYHPKAKEIYKRFKEK